MHYIVRNDVTYPPKADHAKLEQLFVIIWTRKITIIIHVQ